MRFTQLMESELDEALKPAVERLLDLKMNTPEVKEIPRVDEVNRYLDRSIEEVHTAISALPDEKQTSWELLDKLFLQVLAEWNETA